MKRNILWYFIFCLFIVILGLEIFMPRIAENRIKVLLEKETSSIESLKIDVISFPAVKILAGKLDQVEIEAEGILVEGLYLDNFKVKYQDILLRKGFFTGNNTFLNILITEESLNNYLQVNYPDLESLQVKLNHEQVLLSGVIKLFEAKINLQLVGRLNITEENKIVFVPENFQFDDIKISTKLFSNIIEDMGFSFDLNSLNIPLKIDEIKINSGEVLIKSDNLL